MPTLEAIAKPQLSVRLDDGREFAVKPLDGFGYQLSQSAKNEIESIDILFRLAARCLAPNLSRDEVVGTEEVVGISVADAARVVQIASGQISQVEASASPLSEAAATTATE